MLTQFLVTQVHKNSRLTGSHDLDKYLVLWYFCFMISGNEKLVLSGSAMPTSFFETAVEFSGKNKPNILVDTSPKSTEQEYEKFKGLLYKRLGNAYGRPNWLYRSFGASPSPTHAEDMVGEADVLFVCGGSTRLAIERWRTLGITSQIIQRVTNGNLVGSGTSAGAMVWFENGYSDSNQFDVPEGEYWDYSLVPGVDLLPAWVTAHHSDIDGFDRPRAAGFQQCLEKNSGKWETAVGIDNYAALVCFGGQSWVIDTKLEDTNPAAPTNVYLYENNRAASPQVIPSGSIIDMSDLFKAG